MIADHPTALPLRPALRRAAEDRTYGLMIIDAVDGPVELVLCDGRIVATTADGTDIDAVEIVAGLLDADEPTCVIEPIRNRPEVHLAPSVEINQVVHDAVRRLTARPDPIAQDKDTRSEGTDRRAEADRLREEFFARRQSALGARGSFSAPSPATRLPRSQTLHRPPTSVPHPATLPAPQPSTQPSPVRAAAPPASPQPLESNPLPESPSAESESDRPTRKLALRSLIRSLIE